MMLLDLSLGGRHDSAGVAISPRHPVNAGWPSKDKGIGLMTRRSPVRIRSPHPRRGPQPFHLTDYSFSRVCSSGAPRRPSLRFTNLSTSFMLQGPPTSNNREHGRLRRPAPSNAQEAIFRYMPSITKLPPPNHAIDTPARPFLLEVGV